MVPKSIYNDNRFLHSTLTPVRRLYPKHSYGAPTIDEFGTVIFFEDPLEEKLMKSIMLLRIV